MKTDEKLKYLEETVLRLERELKKAHEEIGRLKEKNDNLPMPYPYPIPHWLYPWWYNPHKTYPWWYKTCPDWYQPYSGDCNSSGHYEQIPFTTTTGKISTTLCDSNGHLNGSMGSITIRSMDDMGTD